MGFKPVKVALIGSGNISYTYLNTLVNGNFSIVDMVGCSDLIPERSKARAALFGIRQMTNEEILSDPEIEIVLNTTQLWNHSEVTRQILEAGKHAYSEKAMGSSYEGALANYELAKAKNLRIGSAPDIYMGSAYQTARKLIDEGWIGQPLFAHAYCFRGYSAHERGTEPPANAPYMSRGSTITYDMSGYYVNVLVHLLGSVNRVSGFSRFYEDRVYTNPSHPNYKQPVAKQTGESLMMGCLEFENGTYANLVMCAEGFGPEIPRVEIFGTHGTLTLPDPNCFGGQGLDIYMTRVGNEGPFKIPFTHGFSDADPSIPSLSGNYEPCHNSWRGLAVVDMAWAIRRNRPHRSSAELALHTVEIVNAIDECNKDGMTRTMKSRPGRPEPLAAGFFGASAEAAIDT
ncbi:MAG: Gfo/Idh/MocA family oxidoreductase [Defluviitaleaceae bacterium]|nr:Gfo/Idh/MocA family oxidoreductase [Defluviitaleaceae bacterium]